MAYVEDNGFGKRLERLYEEAVKENPKLTQQEFADKCGITRSNLKCYLQSKHDPSGTSILSVAKGCNVSADWLLGLSRARDRNKAYETACEELQLSEKTIKALSYISKTEYREAYDFFFSCDFGRLVMLFHYLKKYVDLVKPIGVKANNTLEAIDKHVDPGSHERINNDTVMVNHSDLMQLYLSNATREFQKTLECHSGIEFFTEEEITEVYNSLQRSAIEENISRSFDEA